MKNYMTGRMGRRLSVFLIAAVLASVLALASVSEAYVSGFDNAYEKAGDYMLKKHIGRDGIQVGSTAGDWTALGLARSGRLTSAQKNAYYNNVVKFVKENANGKEQLDRAKSTENSRIVLALTAAGIDPRKVEGHNLLKGLSDMNFLEKQGINGPIWALIALDSHKYGIPNTAAGGKQVTRDGLVDYILGVQLDDGGWDLNMKKADPDVTGMALQALAPYYKTNAKVKAAVDKAVKKLESMQSPNGDFISWGSSNSESCDQVIVALAALGIDPANFMSSYGYSVMDALMSYAVSGGGFRHVAGGQVDGMATEQGYYALTAYARFQEGKTSLYDMSDVKIAEKNHQHTWGAWKTTKAATISAKGVKQRTCSSCGDVEKKDIAKLKATIKLNASSIKLKAGQSTSKVKVTYAKGDKVKSWKSSNTKIVKVNSKGKITAQKKTGTAKVTVTLKSGKKATFKVTVQKGEVKTTKISGLKKSVEVKKGKKTTLKPVISPITSVQKVTYATSNKKVATVSSKGVVTGKKKGTAKITVKSGTKKFVVTVKVK